MLLVMFTAPRAVAQEGAHSLTVSPMAGNSLFLTDLIPTFAIDSLDTTVSSGLENQFSPGLRAAVPLSEHLSIEAGILYAATELALDPELGSPVGFDADLLFVGAGGRYLLLPTADVSPFFAAGAGARHLDEDLTTDTETDFMWNVGAGALFETGWVA